MGRFKFKLSDLSIDLHKCLFQFMDTQGCMRQRCIEGAIWLALDQESACHMIHHLLAYLGGDLIDSLEQRRRMPVKTDDLGLAIYTLRNRDNDFIEGCAGNREFFVYTAD